MSGTANSRLSLKESIYQDIKSKILDMSYKPGQLVSETEISQDLQVSRTPVREVFIRLLHEGLLDIFPQKGTYISLIDMDFVNDSVYMRYVVEKQILSELCDSLNGEIPKDIQRNVRLQKDIVDNGGSINEFLELDNEFHKALFDLSNHKQIWRLLSTTKFHYNRYRILSMEEPEMFSAIYEQHASIIDCISRKDKLKLEVDLKTHIFAGLSKQGQVVKKYSSYFK